MPQTAVVTGASSGVGRATAVALAKAGWNVAAVAHRADKLKETIALAGDAASRISAFPCDIASEPAVQQMAAAVQKKFGDVQAVINAAGTNVPKRAWSELSFKEYKEIVDTNLTGAYLCTQAFLPAMRKAKRGTVINIVSDAAITAPPKAGVAYIVSKFAQDGMTKSLNSEERVNGIRGISILPGEINTEILDKRPSPPPAEARLKMLQAEDVADCVMFALNLPDRAVVESLLIRPR